MQRALREIRGDRIVGAPERVTLDATLLDEEATADVGAPRQHVERTERRFGRRRIDVGDQVHELRAREGRSRDLLPLHPLGHLRAVVPHRRREVDRRAELLQPVETRADRPAALADPVADDAALFGEEPATGRGEVAQREEIGGEVTGLARVELRPGDPELPHARRHLGRVVPEGRRQVVERAWTRGAGEVRADLATDPTDRVAFDAALRVEDPLAGEGILGRAEERLGEREARQQQNGGEDESREPHGIRYPICAPLGLAIAERVASLSAITLRRLVRMP